MQFALGYLKYYLTAKNKHHIQAPFLFRLVTEVFNNDHPQTDYIRIEEIRNQLLKNNEKINVEDFGAGSSSGSPVQKSISEIARLTSKQGRYGRLLCRITRYFKPAVMIETGTSLGISALYQASGNPEGKLYSLEGSREIAVEAKKNIEKCNIKNVEVITGHFDKKLPELLNALSTVDYFFFDGNHRLEPTLKYFDWALQKINDNTVFIFDDINWSDEMKMAWKQVYNHPKVTISIDLYMLGIVFFNPDFSKEHFCIRF